MLNKSLQHPRIAVIETMYRSETVRRMAEERTWAVTESGQLELVSFVALFECLVCQREVERLRNRFRPVPYIARLVCV